MRLFSREWEAIDPFRRGILKGTTLAGIVAILSTPLYVWQYGFSRASLFMPFAGLVYIAFARFLGWATVHKERVFRKWGV